MNYSVQTWDEISGETGKMVEVDLYAPCEGMYTAAAALMKADEEQNDNPDFTDGWEPIELARLASGVLILEWRSDRGHLSISIFQPNRG